MAHLEANSSSDDKKSGTSRTKKRKHTYLVRKEEACALEDKIQRLRRKLAALEEANGDDDIKIARATLNNQALRMAVHSQHLAVASAHSMISYHLESQHENPMSTHIHLTKSRSERRETLIAMKRTKFTQCYSYLMERCRCLDMSKDHFSEDRFEDTDGNFTCHRFDVIHFRGVQSLKQVYDALTFFMFNMEISVSEMLGDITIREDYDNLDDGTYASNHRLVSSYESGVTTETNAVSFAQLFGHHNEFAGSPCSIVVADSVDEDDLHPYDTLTRVRRDVTVAVVLTEQRCASTEARSGGSAYSSRQDSDVMDVVVRRAIFIKVHRPEFWMPEYDLLDLYDRVTKWPDVMMQSVRATLAAQSFVLPVAADERAAFYRERAAETYNALWHFIAGTLAKVPYSGGRSLTEKNHLPAHSFLINTTNVEDSTYSSL
ncbi:hypothetical protein ON010_g4233 [Phytophthora cinnamomi]|nr:hypothetical protein ON010_g4233 [Phytophthora cinnamomi]